MAAPVFFPAGEDVYATCAQAVPRQWRTCTGTTCVRDVHDVCTGGAADDAARSRARRAKAEQTHPQARPLLGNRSLCESNNSCRETTVLVFIHF